MPKQHKKGNGKPPRKPPCLLKATLKAGKKKKEPKKQKTPEEIRNAKSHKNGNLNQWDPEQLKIVRQMWDAQQNPRHKGKRWLICGLHKLMGIPNSTLRYYLLKSTDSTNSLKFSSHQSCIVPVNTLMLPTNL